MKKYLMFAFIDYRTLEMWEASDITIIANIAKGFKEDNADMILETNRKTHTPTMNTPYTEYRSLQFNCIRRGGQSVEVDFFNKGEKVCGLKCYTITEEEKRKDWDYKEVLF